ncbi:MAG: hypothetical protein LAP13_14045 [Acidobacteriia bacterium]|nr:hypothetical protein [Terriglobia bacterium]
MNQVLAHDKGSFEFVPLLHRALRVVVVLNWLVILAAVLLRGVPKALALNAFAAFKVSAVCVGALVIAEIVFLRHRSKPWAVLLDAVLGLSMFVFWFFVLASTF